MLGQSLLFLFFQAVSRARDRSALGEERALRVGEGQKGKTGGQEAGEEAVVRVWGERARLEPG